MRMGVRLGMGSAAVAAGLLVVSSGSASAASPPTLSAFLDGHQIALAEVGKYHCEDIAYPRIDCFRTPTERDVAAGPLLASSSTTYVIVFADAAYAGASFVMSEDYPVLATIGWNDRISSFKAQNGLSGRFWTDWFNTGSAYYFCCNQNVSYVGDAWNDTFSSAEQL